VVANQSAHWGEEHGSEKIAAWLVCPLVGVVGLVSGASLNRLSDTILVGDVRRGGARLTVRLPRTLSAIAKPESSRRPARLRIKVIEAGTVTEAAQGFRTARRIWQWSVAMSAIWRRAALVVGAYRPR